MKRAVLFRYYKNQRVAINRLKMIAEYNPGVKIYGLYGGDVKEFPRFKKALAPYLEHNYCIRGKTGFWKWKNGDLSVIIWHKNVGKKLDFDVLNVIEWDLLLFGSLDEIYKKIPKDGLGLTALTPLKNVEKKWYWTTTEPYKTEWAKLLEYARKRYGYRKQPFASLGPGTCLPKEFLDRFINAEVPELCHDELRFPLFGQLLGFKLYDTGFYKKWFDKQEYKYFNCEDVDIKISTIRRELKKTGGRRVFHKFRFNITQG